MPTNCSTLKKEQLGFMIKSSINMILILMMSVCKLFTGTVNILSCSLSETYICQLYISLSLLHVFGGDTVYTLCMTY